MNNTKLCASFNTIINDRAEVINLSIDDINSNLNNFTDYINELINNSLFNTKTINYITKSQNKIQEIIDQINELSTPILINKQRKRLNYYLNKIKQMLISENIETDNLYNYILNITELRSSISNFLRINKRQIKIDEIYKLINKEELTNEENKMLRSLISNEKRFNTRWINKHKNIENITTTNCDEQVTKNDNSNKKLLSLYNIFKGILVKEQTREKGKMKKGLVALCTALALITQQNSSNSVNLYEVNKYEKTYDKENKNLIKVIESKELGIDELDLIYNNIFYNTIYGDEGYRETFNVNMNLKSKSVSENNIENQELVEDVNSDINDEDAKLETFKEMSYEIRKREILTKEQLQNLLQTMCEENPFNIKFETEYDALEYLYFNNDLSYDEKMLVVMARENLTYDELDTVCAGMSAEGGAAFYDEVYRVASVLFNRCHCIRFINEFGDSLYNQFASNQFSVYTLNLYQQYLGQRDYEGYKAAIDVFYSRMPSVDFLSFRAADFELDTTYTQFTSYGNKFLHHMDEDEKVESEYIKTIEIELNQEFDNKELVRVQK